MLSTADGMGGRERRRENGGQGGGTRGGIEGWDGGIDRSEGGH